MKCRTMKWIYSIVLILIFYTQGSSATKIFIERNVSRSDIPADDAFVKEEKDLNEIIIKYHGGKNCTIKISFIDPSPYPSYVQWLVDWWNSVVGEGEEKPADVEILFSLTENDKWKYEGIKITPNFFFKNYFLEKVEEYVKQHIWEGINEDQLIVKRWLNVITNVLDQQYKQKLLTEGANLITVPGYKRSYRLAEWMKGTGFEYNYDLEPYVVDSISASSTLYVSNKNQAKGYFIETIYNYLDDFEYHNPYQKIDELESKIWKKVAERENWNTKEPTHILDDSKIKADTLFHLKNKNEKTKRYRLKITQTPIGNNEKYNIFTDLAVFGWKHTSCNFFAFDLQKKVWGKFLWSPDQAQGATAIYNYLPSDPNFKEIPVTKASEYAEHGFYVICVKSGHVTTMYPDRIRNLNATNYGHVVQAGKEITNNKFLNQIWDEEEFDDVKAYIYLGHLFQ